MQSFMNERMVIALSHGARCPGFVVVGEIWDNDALDDIRDEFKECEEFKTLKAWFRCENYLLSCSS
jgi:hypothetical protein